METLSVTMQAGPIDSSLMLRGQWRSLIVSYYIMLPDGGAMGGHGGVKWYE